ncbi:MAG: glycosyltransferase [Treponemataceae bacterium]|nr:glycosyltransferase [Treponemataceae bacterium]
MSDTVITVLMSTYNGEKYVKQQIDSILAQTIWQKCRLFVRDDGSKDNTPFILQEYADKGLICYEKGENVGFAKSFFYLMQNAEKVTGSSDYYAFCDQDDFWMPNKLETALNCLQNHPDLQKPLLYYSNMEVCDSNLNFVCKNDFRKTPPDFTELCLNSVLYGFTFVFNDILLKKVCQLDSAKIDGHDFILAATAAALGTIISDETVTAKYRRHDANTSQSRNFTVKALIWKIKRFLINRNNRIKLQIENFYDVFKTELKEKDLHLVKLLVGDKSVHFKKLKLLFYPARFRQSIFQDFVLRVFLFLGLL